MSTIATTSDIHPLAVLPRLRDLLSLFASLRDLSQPLTSAAGLRQALSTILQFAQLAGLDATTAARLQTLLQNDQVIDLLLAALKLTSSTVKTS